MNRQLNLAGYGLTWAALVALAGLSLLLSLGSHLPGAPALALAVAVAKALLIATFFMHLSRSRVSIRLAILAAVGLIGILAALMAADILTRRLPEDAGVASQP